MKRPFTSENLQPMLPRDKESGAFLLRPEEFNQLCQADRFLDFLKEMSKEAKLVGVSLEQIVKIHRHIHPRSKISAWSGYNEFMEAAEWLFS